MITQIMTPAKQHRSTSTATSLKQRMKEERASVYRQAINEAAERVFAAKGTEASRMHEIAAEAGISLGTLYGVIDGKESLVTGIHEHRMHGFLDCIRDARDRHTETLASHLAVLRDGAQYFLDRPDFLRICCRAGFGWARRATASNSGSDILAEGVSIPRELFVRGIAEGIFVDDEPELMVQKMLALKQVELTHWADQGMVMPNQVVIDRIEDQFVRAFCTREVQQREAK